MVWRFLISLLSVLRYLHFDKLIIHRDLNPSNIMVDNKNNLKVADFGLAKGISQSLNANNSFVGTLVYSCPQIVQNQTYNEKADIWSLGCIIYEMMALKTPFSGNNPLFIAKNIVNGEYTVDLPEQYSAELRNIVRLCLKK
jgi:serine/threonine protein kinase